MIFVQKPAGFSKSWVNLKNLQLEYCSKDEKLLRLNLPFLNHINGQTVVLLDPKDVRTVYRNEGKYPYRGPSLTAYKMMRQSRQDIFYETTGVLLEDGKRWHDIRSKVQQDLMRPQSAHFYLDAIQDISQEFVDYIRFHKDAESGIFSNFLPHIYRFTFESICHIAMDTRLGCLHLSGMNQDLTRIFEATKKYLGSFESLRTSISWKFCPYPRWNKGYREAQDSLNILLDFGKKHIQEATEKMDFQSSKSNKNKSVLEKMIERNGSESTYPLVMALDLIFGGIDTTGNTLGFLLYHLSANPQKQEILRKECQEIGPHVTVKDLNRFKYLKACIQETFRLTPTVSMLLRMLQEDVVLQGTITILMPEKTFISQNFLVSFSSILTEFIVFDMHFHFSGSKIV